MILPRLAIFKGAALTHMVFLNGDEIRGICSRTVLKTGHIIDPTTKPTCMSCKSGGWDKTRGWFGSAPTDKDENGRYVTREQARGPRIPSEYRM